MDTGSRQENASNKKVKSGFDFIKAGMALRLHQFDPAVQRAATVGAVGADRGEEADAGGAEPGPGDLVTTHEVLGDGLGAVARQLEVVGRCALAVGMADDIDVEPGLTAQQLRDLVEGGRLSGLITALSVSK